MSALSLEPGAIHARRRAFVLAALVSVALIVAGVGSWKWLAGGPSHPPSQASVAALATAPPSQASIAALATTNCAHAVATEPTGASWIPVTSSAPSDVAAVMESGGLAMMESRLGPLTLDMPALAYPLNMRTGYDANDCPHWVAPFHDSAGKVSGDVDYVFDPSGNRMRFSTAGTILPGDSRFGKTFPYVTLDQALSLLRLQRHVTGDTRNAPMLVFFALKHGWGGSGQPPDRSATHFWNDSGTVATDPMWRIIGADGKVYFVGARQQVYAEADVPLA